MSSKIKRANAHRHAKFIECEYKRQQLHHIDSSFLFRAELFTRLLIHPEESSVAVLRENSSSGVGVMAMKQWSTTEVEAFFSVFCLRQPTQPFHCDVCGAVPTHRTFSLQLCGYLPLCPSAPKKKSAGWRSRSLSHVFGHLSHWGGVHGWLMFSLLEHDSWSQCCARDSVTSNGIKWVPLPLLWSITHLGESRGVASFGGGGGSQWEILQEGALTPHTLQLMGQLEEQARSCAAQSIPLVSFGTSQQPYINRCSLQGWPYGCLPLSGVVALPESNPEMTGWLKTHKFSMKEQFPLSLGLKESRVAGSRGRLRTVEPGRCCGTQDHTSCHHRP